MLDPFPMLFSVPSGNTVKVDVATRNWKFPLTIMCCPGGGGTVEVLSSNDVDAMTNGSAKFIDSGESTMSVDTEIARYTPCTVIALKANSAAATFRLMM